MSALPTLTTHTLGAWPEPVAVDPERVIAGTPAASTIVLGDQPGRQFGLWRVSAGEFTTSRPDYLEYVHILSGTGALVSDEGDTTELAAGVSVLIPRGWSGRWVIGTELTKVFSIIHTDGEQDTP